MNNVFEVTRPVLMDESIKNFSNRPIYSYNNNQFGLNDEVIYTIQQHEAFTLPSESQLLIEIEFIRPPAAASATEEDKKLAEIAPIGLSEFAICHLFSKITYLINGQKIDEVTNPGITTTLKSGVSITDGEWKKYDHTFFHEVDYTTKKIHLSIPLSQIMGFMEDYKRIIFNARQDLVLVRSQTNDNAIHMNPYKSGVDLKITKMVWLVPFLEPSDSVRLELLKMIQNNTKIQIPFRNWSLYSYPNLPANTKKVTWPIRTVTSLERPRYVLVGFQTERANNQKADAGKFDHCKIKNIILHLGSQQYPHSPFNVDFENTDIVRLYNEYAKFQLSYYGRNPCEPVFGPTTFKDKFPVWVIDCQHQSEQIPSNVDIKIEIESDFEIPAKTACHALIISDHLIEYSLLTGLVKQIV